MKPSKTCLTNTVLVIIAALIISVNIFYFLIKKSENQNLTGLLTGRCSTNERVFIKSSKVRIIGGDEVVPHSVPFQVGLKINGNRFCGGALISQNYVLTAAHCGVVIYTVDLVLGAHNISNSEEETQVVISGETVINHEEYNRSNYRNDIALIKLSTPAPLNDNIQLATLPSSADSSRTYEGQLGRATGWGLVKDVAFPSIRDMSDVLMGVDVAVLSSTVCGEYYNDEEETYITATNICTSGYRNKGTCDGDSGGPLTVDGVLVGLTSFGTKKCEMCSPSAYTHVGKYLDWIAAHSDVSL